MRESSPYLKYSMVYIITKVVSIMNDKSINVFFCPFLLTLNTIDVL